MNSEKVVILDMEGLKDDSLLGGQNPNHETLETPTKPKEELPSENTHASSSCPVGEDVGESEPDKRSLTCCVAEENGLLTKEGTMVNNDEVTVSEQGKIEDSGDGINLFVEVFGPLNSEHENNSDKEVSEEAKQEFMIGDLVWVKTNTHLWWPAIVCDPSKEDILITESDNKMILVKYFDTNKLFWCSQSPSQLKPFVENLEDMAKQDNSRSFLCATEMGISEINRRIKMEMTCSCFSKSKQSQKSGVFSGFSASKFESTTFLSSIRNLGKCISMPERVDYAIIQNCLSAFYRSSGHRQLPMHQLRPKSEDKSEKEIKFSEASSDQGRKSINGVGSRERKKSKYLSYPYVNSDKGSTKTPSSSATDSSLGAKTNNTPKSKFKKKGSSKPIISESTLDVTKVSSAKLLADLRLTALNCHYPMKSECSESFKNLVSSFRKFAFLNQQQSDGVILDTYLPEEINSRKRKKKEKACSSNDNVASLANNSQEIKDPKVPNKRKNKTEATPGDKLEPKRRKKTENRKSIKTKNGMVMPGVSVNLKDMPGNNVTSINETVEPMTSQLKVASEHINEAVKLMACESNEQVNETVKPVANQSNATTVHINEMVKAIATEYINESVKVMANQSNATTEHINETVKELATQSNGATEQVKETNGVLSSSSGKPMVEHTNSVLSSSPSVKPECKKRKRKEKQPNGNGSGVPDLNGNVSPVIKKPKQPRKRRNKTDTGILPPSVSCSKYSAKIENHIEALGAILLLNFVPGSSLPTKESLISTFSVFGAVKESETQVLNDSSAQIVFVKSSDAGNACRSLERTNPFGAALSGFRLNYSASGASSARVSEQINKAGPTMVPLKPQTHDGNHPPSDLETMKRNLEMMKSMLEKAGNNVSPEMKAKLENEIKGFMIKVNSVR